MHILKGLLDPGHSDSRLSPGVTILNGLITEHGINLYQSKLLQEELKFDFVTDIVDPVKDNRVAIGMKAKGYDIFVSLHLNASGKHKNYTTVVVASRHNSPDSRSSKLASVCAVEIATALDIPIYHGPNYPVGVMPRQLEVLNYAHRSGCPICLLVESFFMDVYNNRQELEKDCQTAMKALANVLRKAIK